MNWGLDRIHVCCGGFLGISDDLIAMKGKILKNKMAVGGYCEKMADQKSL